MFISFSKFLLQLFKWIRDCQKKRKSRLSSKHLKKIPIKKFKKGENPKLLGVSLTLLGDKSVHRF